MVSSAEHDTGFWPSLYAQLRGTDLDAREWFSPLASAVATGTDYEIRVELPGVPVDDIDITVENDSIVVKGEKKNVKGGADDLQFFDERLDGHFVRSFKLPADADLAAFTSQIRDGVLLIAIPRQQAAAPQGIHPVRVDP